MFILLVFYKIGLLVYNAQIISNKLGWAIARILQSDRGMGSIGFHK